MTAYSPSPDSPFAEGPRPPHFEPNALDLAKLAAALDPILAKKEPAKAARLAQQLISAAQDYINEPYSRHRNEVDYWEQDAKKRRLERLFPARDCVSLLDAFEQWPGKYTTFNGFAKALRKERLTIRSSKRGELTSHKAVEELARIHKEREKARDNLRKLKAGKENFQESRREIGLEEPEHPKPKRETKRQKREP